MSTSNYEFIKFHQRDTSQQRQHFSRVLEPRDNFPSPNFLEMLFRSFSYQKFSPKMYKLNFSSCDRFISQFEVVVKSFVGKRYISAITNIWFCHFNLSSAEIVFTCFCKL